MNWSRPVLLIQNFNEREVEVTVLPAGKILPADNKVTTILMLYEGGGETIFLAFVAK